MKKISILGLLCIGLVASASAEIAITGTNVTLRVQETTVLTNETTISTLVIEELQYRFDPSFIRVTLRYEDGGEVLAKGWASIVPLNDTDYKVTYYHNLLENTVSLTVPKASLDSLGLQDGLTVVQQLAYALGNMLTQVTALP